MSCFCLAYNVDQNNFSNRNAQQIWCAQRLCIKYLHSSNGRFHCQTVRSEVLFHGSKEKRSYEKENKRSLFPFGGTWCRYIPGDRASRSSHIRPRVNSGGFRVDTWRSLWVNTKMDFEYIRAACIAALLLFRFASFFLSFFFSFFLYFFLSFLELEGRFCYFWFLAS